MLPVTYRQCVGQTDQMETDVRTTYMAAKMIYTPTSYGAARELFAAHATERRMHVKLGHNADLVRLVGDVGHAYAVRQHDTNVVTFYQDGKIRLSTGGWASVTTLARLRAFTPTRYGSDGQQQHGTFVGRFHRSPGQVITENEDGSWDYQRLPPKAESTISYTDHTTDTVHDLTHHDLIIDKDGSVLVTIAHQNGM